MVLSSVSIASFIRVEDGNRGMEGVEDVIEYTHSNYLLFELLWLLLVKMSRLLRTCLESSSFDLWRSCYLLSVFDFLIFLHNRCHNA